jgi:hypothetical protein
MTGFALMATIGSLSVALTGTVSAGQTSGWKQMSIIDRTRAERQNAPPRDRTDQNYPNPLEASTGFKTIIPFTTVDEGMASIRIVDVTGKEVLKDAEEVTYAGTHFFYFTGDKLPAGTYYYQIQFPLGVVIQNKTMLIVK